MQSTNDKSPRSPFNIAALQSGAQEDGAAVRADRTFVWRAFEQHQKEMSSPTSQATAPSWVQPSDTDPSDAFSSDHHLSDDVPSFGSPKTRKERHPPKAKGIHKRPAPKAGGAVSPKAGVAKSPMAETGSPKSGDDSPMTGGALLRTRSVTAGFGQAEVNRSWETAPDRNRNATKRRAKAREQKTAQNGSDAFSSLE
jgi:hypothetical protein